jgi:ribosomal-protein-alanine N-acetyltransferase
MMFLRRWRAAHVRLVALGMRDAVPIAQLHAAGFARGWSDGEVEALLHGRGVVAIGMRLGTTILGVMLLRVAADEAEILSIAVAPEWRGCGFARRMLDHGLDRAAALRARRCFLEVDAANAAAMALYRRIGFREIGRRKGYYAAEGGGDALIMARGLDDRVPSFPWPETVEKSAERQ